MKFIIANLIQNFMILIIKHSANLNQVQVDEIFFVHNNFSSVQVILDRKSLSKPLYFVLLQKILENRF